MSKLNFLNKLLKSSVIITFYHNNCPDGALSYIIMNSCISHLRGFLSAVRVPPSFSFDPKHSYYLVLMSNIHSGNRDTILKSLSMIKILMLDVFPNESWFKDVIDVIYNKIHSNCPNISRDEISEIIMNNVFVIDHHETYFNSICKLDINPDNVIFDKNVSACELCIDLFENLILDVAKNYSNDEIASFKNQLVEYSKSSNPAVYDLYFMKPLTFYALSDNGDIRWFCRYVGDKDTGFVRSRRSNDLKLLNSDRINAAISFLISSCKVGANKFVYGILRAMTLSKGDLEFWGECVMNNDESIVDGLINMGSVKNVNIDGVDYKVVVFKDLIPQYMSLVMTNSIYKFEADFALNVMVRVTDENKKILICSLRSHNGISKVIAEKFGGGGHPNAAGFNIPFEKLESHPFKSVVENIIS